MPATRRSKAPVPTASPRVAAGAPPRPNLHSIGVREVAFGFVAMHWIFVGFIVLAAEILGTHQVLLTFEAQALIGVLIWNTGSIIALLLVIWLIKGCAEARWYGIAIGFVLQLCLAIYIYPTSRWFSALTCVSLAAAALGVLKRRTAQPRKLRAA